jgi:hypothetical protein
VALLVPRAGKDPPAGTELEVVTIDYMHVVSER